jgi:hypothetical protein
VGVSPFFPLFLVFFFKKVAFPRQVKMSQQNNTKRTNKKNTNQRGEGGGGYKTRMCKVRADFFVFFFCSSSFFFLNLNDLASLAVLIGGFLYSSLRMGSASRETTARLLTERWKRGETDKEATTTIVETMEIVTIIRRRSPL